MTQIRATVNVNVDEIRTAMKAEYTTARAALERANPGLMPGEIAAALEKQGWRHLDGRIGKSLYGYHPPATTGGYSDKLTHTNTVAIQYALGSPSCHGLVVIKDAAA